MRQINTRILAVALCIALLIGFTATCTVTVDGNAVAVTGVSLNRDSMTLKVRETEP